MKKLIVILLFVLVACDREDAWDIVKTRGEHAVEERTLPPFHTITIHNGIHVALTHGDRYSATIEGWKNLMPKIRLMVDHDGELVIDDVNNFNFVRSRDNMTTVRLTIPNELYQINFSGNGDIVSKDTIFTSGLSVISTGSGRIDLTVKAQGVYIGTNHRNTASVAIRGQGYSVGITNWGFGPVDVSSFKASHAHVVQHGAGSSYIYASESIHVTLNSGAGDVFYTGNPSSKEITHGDKAQGNLRKMDSN